MNNNLIRKIIKEILVLLDLFSIHFRRIRHEDTRQYSLILVNIGEAVVNLFMKLQISNFTKINDFGVKLKEIKARI